MNDRELLVLAAQAAGLELDWDVPDGASPWVITGEGADRDASSPWNPLEDDGDALRLAAYLGIEVFVNRHARCVMINRQDPYQFHQSLYDSDDLIYETTRRAIVRAASKMANQPLSGK